jgi:hypothetical protein
MQIRQRPDTNDKAELTIAVTVRDMPVSALVYDYATPSITCMCVRPAHLGSPGSAEVAQDGGSPRGLRRAPAVERVGRSGCRMAGAMGAVGQIPKGYIRVPSGRQAG